MKIRITCLVLATLRILPTLASSTVTTDNITSPKTTISPSHNISDPTKPIQNKESSTGASPRQGSEERQQEERELREKFEKKERKYYDKRITNLEKNIQNMLANLYLSASKKMELNVALALLRKAVSNKDIDVKKFAYKEAFDIIVRVLP
ncbi:uncharacterized protein LOC128858473 [Anastrepha ludens]|uniref:uncharacterized protein LOC128858473 n=1 Tax=Anastrepha ludens TaxID=28586 RepID=UPI0023AF73B0|nr:uncharacterized protein LOC128858473 [Anastrepha ludens]